jgi:hypothetical protein
LTSGGVPRVNNNGDVLIGDEYRIKIFDKNGKEKKILGKQGDGPGEFSSDDPIVYTSPTSWTAANCRANMDIISIYDPDYNLAETIRLDKEAIFEQIKSEIKFENSNISKNSIQLFSYYALNKAESVFGFYISDKFCIAYQNDKVVKIITWFKDPTSFSTTYKGKTVGAFGGLTIGNSQFQPLPDKKIVYFNTDEDKYKDGKGYYSFHLFSLMTFKDSVITKEYTLTLYPSEEEVIRINSKSRLKDERHKALLDKELSIMKNRKYIPSILLIIPDRHYIYVFLYNDIKFSKKRFTVDIFDTYIPAYVKTISLPEFYITIFEGCIYTSTSDADGYPIIQKFRLKDGIQ